MIPLQALIVDRSQMYAEPPSWIKDVGLVDISVDELLSSDPSNVRLRKQQPSFYASLPSSITYLIDPFAPSAFDQASRHYMPTLSSGLDFVHWIELISEESAPASARQYRSGEPFELGTREVSMILRAERELLRSEFGEDANACAESESENLGREYGDRVIGALAGIAHDMSAMGKYEFPLSRAAGRFLPYVASEILECFSLDPNDHSDFLRLVHEGLFRYLTSGGSVSAPWGAVSAHSDGLLHLRSPEPAARSGKAKRVPAEAIVSR